MTNNENMRKTVAFLTGNEIPNCLNKTAVIKRYNNLVECLGYEHVAIGTRLSEGTENWNLRDMVAEVSYILGTYYEEGHCNFELKEDDYKEWVSHTGKLKRFISRFEPYVADLICAEKHCSEYDNVKERK